MHFVNISGANPLKAGYYRRERNRKYSIVGPEVYQINRRILYPPSHSHRWKILVGIKLVIK